MSEEALGFIEMSFLADDGIGPFISKAAWVSLGEAVTRWAIAHDLADLDITIHVRQHEPPKG